MPIFLPIANLSINAFWLIGVGGLVGFLSGLLGVGGGFLLTPILMLIGISPTIAAASGTNSMVATSSSAVAAHFRRGNVDIKMGAILLFGGLTGAAIGVEVIKILRAIGNADLLIELTYIFILGGVGGFMFLQSVRGLRRSQVMMKTAVPQRPRRILEKLPFQVYFPRSGVRHSVLVLFGLCTLVGVLAGIMGVGGGFLMVPMMVYLLHIPPHVAVGTDLFQILFTCAGTTLMQSRANHTVDVVLALLVAAGSTIGAQIGAAVSKLLRGEQLMILLASLALLVVGKMTVGLVSAPANLLQAAEGEYQAAAHPQVPQPEPRAAAGTAIKLTPDQVTIGATYSGQQIRIEGFVDPGSQVVVVARGPDTQERFQRKGRAGPIWVTRGSVEISGVPSLFIRYAPKPAEQFLSGDQIEEFQLDPAAIRRQMQIVPADRQEKLLRQDYIRFKVAQREYRVVDGAVQIGPPTASGVPYAAEFHWPRKAPPDTYEIRVHECRGGMVVKTVTAPLRLVKAGFPAAVAELSGESAATYGILAVLAAICAGFGTDLIVNLRKRLRRRAPLPAETASLHERPHSPARSRIH